MGTLAFSFIALLLSVAAVTVRAQTDPRDVSAMQDIKNSLVLPHSLDWSSGDPCSPWTHVHCSGGRVDAIQLGGTNVSGTVSPSIRNLTALRRFEVMNCGLSGPLPSFSGLSNLQAALLHHNSFTSIPSDFFQGLTGLQTIDLSYNSFAAWSIPDSLRTATSLQNFTAVAANIVGSIPDIFDSVIFPSLVELHLSFNNFIGGLPASFADSSIQSLWLNGKAGHSLLNGTIDVLAGMTGLVEVWLHYNQFTGLIPDLSRLENLQDLSLRDNQLTGVVPASLMVLPSLRAVNLTNNLLQGPTPAFASAVRVDMAGINSFCLPTPGVSCAPEVNTLLSIAQAVGYPLKFAQDWKGNSPCDSGNPCYFSLRGSHMLQGGRGVMTYVCDLFCGVFGCSRSAVPV
ncbi:hypothetical protein MLD38_025136 [Melastoma candidum]|uniref:Uncharacterized protein n=1 Tax=Melastoma candidum TaxID=119954 RepID=A0ACB9NUF2_9MYRT|nr:hypothetical protein MLD38_025136 [Melastoma candidum]